MHLHLEATAHGTHRGQAVLCRFTKCHASQPESPQHRPGPALAHGSTPWGPQPQLGMEETSLLLPGPRGRVFQRTEQPRWRPRCRMYSKGHLANLPGGPEVPSWLKGRIDCLQTKKKLMKTGETRRVQAQRSTRCLAKPAKVWWHPEGAGLHCESGSPEGVMVEGEHCKALCAQETP